MTPCLVLLLLSLACPVAFASSPSWHVPDAVLKFTIETDPNHLKVPNTDVQGRETRGGNWSGGYYRIDGKLYKDAVAMRCPAEATYRCPDGARRFVALVGVRQDAGDSASIAFEVFADTRKLYSSPPRTKYLPPMGIDVRVPPRAKQIRLVTTGSDSQGHHWAGWANAGFWTRTDDPRVGYVTLPVPGFDPSQYEVAVFTGDGKRVAAMRLGTPEEGKIDYLFFAGHGWSTYYAYWVPREQYEPAAQDWQPDAGLVLETRRVDKSHRRACEDLPGFMKVWKEADQVVGRSVVGGIHHAYPVHPCLTGTDDKGDKSDLALYRYTGYFEIEKPGEYVFATASNWGSHLLVDDKPVVSWPGNHNYRDGIKGQKRGKVTLQPGIHKLDYLNYSPWGTMFTLAAWRPPGGKLSVMTERDFPAIQGYSVTGVEYNFDDRKQVSFEWNVVDDWRLDRDKMSLIRMRFRVIDDWGEDKGHIGSGRPEDAGKAETTPGASLIDYRWTFDDGVIRTGQATERVFLRPGEHSVTLQRFRGGQMIAETTQVVHAGNLAEKIWVDPRNPDAFRQEISRMDLHRAPIEDVIDLRRFAIGLSETTWRNRTTQALLARTDELLARPEYQPLCLELCEHLSSAPVQRYDQAMTLYARLQERTPEGTPIRQETMVREGELLLRCLGQPDAALGLLNQARWEKARNTTWTIRHGLARAETLLAVGQMDDLAEQMGQLRQVRGQADAPRRDLRHAGLLRQAQELARPQDDKGSEDDLTSLNTAMDDLQTVLYEDPSRILSPSLNLIRLDIHLARGEYRMAQHLAERLAKLDLSPYDRAEVLVRHVQALCALGNLTSAGQILGELVEAYPNSEQCLNARALLAEAAASARSR